MSKTIISRFIGRTLVSILVSKDCWHSYNRLTNIKQLRLFGIEIHTDDKVPSGNVYALFIGPFLLQIGR